jgi:hypothetical protein
VVGPVILRTKLLGVTLIYTEEEQPCVRTEHFRVQRTFALNSRVTESPNNLTATVTTATRSQPPAALIIAIIRRALYSLYIH